MGFSAFRGLLGLELRTRWIGALLWTLLLVGLVLMGLAFYPALSQTVGEMEALFETPMMSAVLSAFGADARALSSLSGYYVTYASIYVTLLGCVFAGLLGARALAGDEADGLAEYLLTRPARRMTVLLAKLTAVTVLLLLLNLIVLAGGFLGLELFGGTAPYSVQADTQVTTAVADAAERDPRRFRDVVGVDEALFDEVALAMARGQLAGAAASDFDAAGVDRAAIESLMESLEQKGPSGFIEEARSNPGQFKDVLNVELTEDELESEVEALAEEFATMRASFLGSGGEIAEMVRMAPAPFIRRLASGVEGAAATPSIPELSVTALEGSFGELGIAEGLASRALVQYSARGVVVLAVYTTLAMLAFAGVGFGVSASVRKPDIAVGAVLAIVFLAYFVDVVTQATGAVALSPLSPFAMIDDRITDPDFRLRIGRLLYFLAWFAVSSTVGAVVFHRKDIQTP